MYITTIFSKLSKKNQKKIQLFYKNNYNQNNYDFEPFTIIILDLLDNNIIGCICFYDNKFLLEKLKNNNIALKYYCFKDLHGCFIYNFCVDKNYRNKKIGTNLLLYSINKMKEIHIDYLHTQAENEISKKLFIKYDFVENDNFIGTTNNEVFILSKIL